MIPELHPEAKANYDSKAQLLIDLIQEMRLPERNTSFDSPDIHVAHTISTADIIGEPKYSISDYLGQETGRIFKHNKVSYGIKDGNYLEVVRLATAIQQRPTLMSILSGEYIKDELLSWIIASFRENTRTSFIDYLFQHAEKSIMQYDIWMPIPFTVIQRPFTLGRIKYETVTKERIEEWLKDYDRHAKSSDDIRNMEAYKSQMKKEHQGYAAGVYSCIAEAKRAEEVAFDHFKNSLSILRLLSPANQLPGLISGAYEYGRNMIESKSFFMTNHEENIFIDSSDLLDRGLRWTIINEDIDIIESDEFNKYHDLLNNDNPSEFQSKLLEALIIYSKNTLRRDMFDKMLYILVALETMLLRNDSEPIQQNIGDRMAFAIANDPSDRKKIVSTLKEIYVIRSKFLHHGLQTKEQSDLIQEFQRYAWVTFHSLVQNSQQFQTKEACIRALDHIKYS